MAGGLEVDGWGAQGRGMGTVGLGTGAGGEGGRGLITRKLGAGLGQAPDPSGSRGLAPDSSEARGLAPDPSKARGLGPTSVGASPRRGQPPKVWGLAPTPSHHKKKRL